MPPHTHPLLSLTALAVLLAACAAPPAMPDRAALDALAIKNARYPMAHVITAGQLTPEQLDALVALGVRDFVNLRQADEDGTGWEEARTAELGARYVRIPVAGAAGITTENASHLADALDDSAGRPTVVYCGSSNRVGALFALKSFSLDGEPAAAALALGKAAGVTRLEPMVRDKLGLPPQ